MVPQILVLLHRKRCAELEQCLRGVKRHPFFIPFLEKVAKRWPKLGYKRKKILHFAHLELLAKSLWCPEQECFNYFLLCPIVYNCVFCTCLYIQITQQNPAKYQKGGPNMAKGLPSSFCIIPACLIRISMFYQTLLHKDG